jgi:hypothetical protein
LPEVQADNESMGSWGYAVHLRKLQAPDFCNRGNHLSRHAKALEGLVHCNLVGNHAEKRRERYGTTKGSRVEELHNIVDVASKNSHCNGKSKPNETIRGCRS